MGWQIAIGFLASLQIAADAGTPALVTDQCARTRTDEVVVCGSRNTTSPYRLPKLPKVYDEKPLRAETDAIPGIHTRAHVESEKMLDGKISKRLLVTFSIPF
jgi:hypothetical protein